MARSKNDNNQEDINLGKINISSPVLFQNKTFSASHLKPNFSIRNKIKQNTNTITTENVIPLLKEEAEQEEITKDLIENSYKVVEKQRSKKKRWLSFAFLMINLVIMAVVFIYQFCNEEPVSFADLLSSKMNWWWLIIGITLFLIINVLDSMRISIGIKKVTGRARPFLSFKSTITCRLYDSLTPLATGGQPFQIYYLSKRGINASTASSVPLAKYVYSQISLVIFTGIVLLSSATLDMHIEPTLVTLALVGLIVNALIIFAVFSLSVSKKVAPRIMIWILKLGYKMHIVKDYKSAFRKVMRTVREYSKTFKMFMKSGWVALGQFLVSMLYLLAFYSVPFVVYCMFNEFDISVWYKLLVLQVVCDLALSFIPIPGGAGTAELSFSVLFSQFFKTSQGIFVWAMLFWRFFTYYAYLVQGAILLLYDFLIGNRKIKPLLKRFEDEDRQKNLNLNSVIANTKSKNKSETTNKSQVKRVNSSNKKDKK